MSSTLSPLRVGVIGCGHWGPNHVRVFSTLKGSNVTSVADTSEQRLTAVLDMFPHVRGFRDHLELLHEGDVDAVVVVAPTKSHFQIVTDALRAGKHVLCEKPLCADPDEARQMLALARSKGLVLMVGHTFLFNAGIQKVKQLIDAGELGRVRSLSAARTNLGPVRSDVNAAWDLAAHDVAVYNWLLEAEPVEVQAMGASFLQPGIEDVVSINLRYPGDVLASIQCSWLDPKKVRQMTVVGSKRMITWDDLALSNPVAIYEKSVETNVEVTDYGHFLRLSMLDGDVRLPKVQASEPLRNQNAAFVNAVQGGGPVLSDAAFGLSVVEVLNKVEQALRSGQQS